MSSPIERVLAWAGADEDWQRPAPGPADRRFDVRLAVIFTLVGLLNLELMRSLGFFESDDSPVWVRCLVLAIGTGALAWRRVHPLLVGTYLAAHMIVVGLVIPIVMASTTMQVTYFFGVFCAVAWSRNRQAMVIVIGAVLVMMFSWIALYMAVGSGLDDMVRGAGGAAGHGLFGPGLAAAIYQFVLNGAYFGGAILLGRNDFRSARRKALIEDQAATIQSQAERLRDQAVVAERLRIARELHDVVAHHVSVMGVQAAGARRVLGKDPAAAESALRTVEQAARDAVTQMRGLLGALRSGESGAHPGASGDPSGDSSGTVDRSPEPGLAELPALIASFTGPGFSAEYSAVEEYSGAMEAVPQQIGLPIYRVVQESLANVRKHSTAVSARVVVRADRRWVEAEILDDGRPKGPSTSGSGLGLLGIRERISALGGSAEIGPRITGGYRVRVRFALNLDDSLDTRRRARDRFSATA